jgi:Cu+-exporting ATPase
MTQIKIEPSITYDIGIGGMTCGSCVARVEKALKKMPGVLSASVNLATESARVEVASHEVNDARLRRAVRDAGYEPRTPEAQADVGRESTWAGFMPVGG